MTNRKIALALVLAAVATGNAFADDITVDTSTFVSSRTRAEVRAELAQYKRAGVNPWSISFNPVRNLHSDITRAEVTAEYLAESAGVAAFTGEDSGSSYLARNRVVQRSNRFAGQPLRTL